MIKNICIYSGTFSSTCCMQITKKFAFAFALQWAQIWRPYSFSHALPMYTRIYLKLQFASVLNTGIYKEYIVIYSLHARDEHCRKEINKLYISWNKNIIYSATNKIIIVNIVYVLFLFLKEGVEIKNMYSEKVRRNNMKHNMKCIDLEHYLSSLESGRRKRCMLSQELWICTN